MKNRVLYGWNFTRAFYAILGLIILVQAFLHIDWMGILLGGYFTAMGIFNLGCASGACFSNTCTANPARNQSIDKS